MEKDFGYVNEFAERLLLHLRTKLQEIVPRVCRVCLEASSSARLALPFLIPASIFSSPSPSSPRFAFASHQALPSYPLQPTPILPHPRPFPQLLATFPSFPPSYTPLPFFPALLPFLPISFPLPLLGPRQKFGLSPGFADCPSWAREPSVQLGFVLLVQDLVQRGSMAAAHPMPATASLVGNAFVSQYYNVLHQSPHVVHRFYTDESKLSRAEAGPNGAVDTVATMAGIREKVMSMDYGGIRAEIKTVDSQESLKGSVLVMVTGSLSSQSRAKRNFVQTFFLAPQEKGYFVLNDMFRYLDGEILALQPLSPMANGTSDLDQTPDVPEQGIGESHLATLEEVREYPSSALEEGVSSEDHYQPPEEEEEDAPEIEDEIPEEIPTVEPGASASEEQLPPAEEEANLEEAPKKSYASILRVRSDSSGSPVTTPKTAVHKTPPAQADRFTSSSQVSQVATPSAGTNLASNEPDEGGASDLEGDGRSVYVKNLPLTITSPELEKEFQKFGPLKPGGVNLRNQRLGVCFAFIEFEDSSSAQSAIQASPLSMGGRQVYVEEKRPMPIVPRAARGRGYQGRGYQNDGMRGRGYFAGRGSGRGSVQDPERDFNNRGRGGRGSYAGGNTYPSNNYGSSFSTVNGYRRADMQGGNGARSVRRGSGNQMGRGRGLGAE